MKNFAMAISFTNGKYIEIGISHVGLQEMKERAFKSLRKSDIMECENIAFRFADVAFVAFLEKKENNSGLITDDKIEDNGSDTKD